MDLKVKIHGAFNKLIKNYHLTDGQTYLAFSGGRDSTVVFFLILLAIELGQLPQGSIPCVFADTKIEYDAIYEFVDMINNEYKCVKRVVPKKSFIEVLKKYGLPSISKMKSELLSTWINQRENDQRESMYRCKCLLHNEFDITKQDGTRRYVVSKNKIANKHIHFLHDDLEYKVSSKCCDYLKKKPFKDYAKQNNMNGYLSGVRIGEGGARSIAYKTCTSVSQINGRSVYHTMPIWDWADGDIQKFIDYFDIPLSRCYTEYGLDRTGCAGCPYAKDLYANLKVLHDFEPKKYKFWINLLEKVYIDMGIELDFDDDYMDQYRERRLIIEQRNKEMMEKYRKKNK